MPRSIADLSLSFGLVTIPVKLYSATQASSGVHFNLLHKTCGSRLRQQYICIKEDVVVPRDEMVKGYEFQKDQYVTFTNEELKALEEASTQSVDIVAFVPLGSIDPIYYDKAYYLAPDKRGGRPYQLLVEGMRKTGRGALARWAWRGKQYMTLVRPGPEGLILQQLLYADEVRSMKELDIPDSELKKGELDLALQLIEQIAQDSYDPDAWHDEVKQRVEAAVDQKIAGQQVTVAEEPQHQRGGQVIDLMEALRASLKQSGRAGAAQPAGRAAKAADGQADEEADDTAAGRKSGAKTSARSGAAKAAGKAVDATTAGRSADTGAAGKSAGTRHSESPASRRTAAAKAAVADDEADTTPRRSARRLAGAPAPASAAPAPAPRKRKAS